MQIIFWLMLVYIISVWLSATVTWRAMKAGIDEFPMGRQGPNEVLAMGILVLVPLVNIVFIGCYLLGSIKSGRLL